MRQEGEVGVVKPWLKYTLEGVRDFTIAAVFIGGFAAISGWGGGEAYAVTSHAHSVCYSSAVSPGSSAAGNVSSVETAAFPGASVALLTLSGHRYLVRESGALLLYPGESVSPPVGPLWPVAGGYQSGYGGAKVMGRHYGSGTKTKESREQRPRCLDCGRNCETGQARCPRCRQIQVSDRKAGERRG